MATAVVVIEVELWSRLMVTLTGCEVSTPLDWRSLMSIVVVVWRYLTSLEVTSIKNILREIVLTFPVYCPLVPTTSVATGMAHERML
jgi:hypothetical protein